MCDYEIIIEEMKEETKKTQSVKRTKAKYYQNNVKEYYLEHKEHIVDQAKQRRDKKKLDTVKAKLELMDTEQLAKILIEARKTKLLD